MSFITQIRNAKPGDTCYDKGERGSVKGLQLRVLSETKKCFYLYYRTKTGTQRRPKLGEFPSTTVGEARNRAKVIMDEVAIGRDPQGQWKAARQDFTVKALYELVYNALWAELRYEQSGWARFVRNTFDNQILPVFGSRKVQDISPLEVQRWHDSYKDKPYQGNRAHEMLARVFTFAEKKGWIEQGTNPCRLTTPHKEKKRKRYATPEELRDIVKLLEREKDNHPGGVAFLYLLMFTGSRPRAIERATWEQLTRVEKDGKIYGVLSFKGKTSEDSGEDEMVIIPPFVMTIIESLPKVEGMSITGTKMPRRLWLKITEELGCQDLWARDLRRTFATLGLSSGIGLSAIGELLNHKSNDTTKIYAKLQYDARIQAVDIIADKIKALTFVSEHQAENDCSHESSATLHPKTESNPPASKLH